MAEPYRPIDPLFLAEVKRRTSLCALIGESVALKPAGREAKGLCPFHKERHPSFFVIEAKGFWYCFGCGERGDAIAWVRKTTNARDFAEAVEYLAARAGMSASGPALTPRPIVARDGEAALAEKRAKKIGGARGIWAATHSALWSPVERYLRDNRRIRLALPPTLRFAPALPHPFLKRDIGFPAMVGAVQSAERKIVGVHCTYLTPDGSGKMRPPPGWPDPEEWKPKIMRGECRQGAVRLTAAEDLMVVAEGIETALSVLQALWDDELGAPHIDGEPVAVWAALSLGNMGAIVLPDGVREVILAADGDGKLPDAGSPQTDPEELILAAAARHRDAGRNVRIARPPAGTDFNDLVPQGAGIAAAGAAGLVGGAA